MALITLNIGSSVFNDIINMLSVIYSLHCKFYIVVDVQGKSEQYNLQNKSSLKTLPEILNQTTYVKTV